MRRASVLAVVLCVAGCQEGTRLTPPIPPTMPGPGNASPDFGMSGHVDMAEEEAPLDCNSCVQTAVSGSGACATAYDTCQSSTGCATLVNCLDPCTTEACVSLCFAAASATDRARYDAIGACLCDNACTQLCASECGPPQPGGIDGATTTSDGGASCTPKTCADLAPACGPVSDGCGHTLTCGCSGGLTCSGKGLCIPAFSGAIDTVTCHGPAAMSGTVAGYAPHTTVGTTSRSNDPASGENYLVLLLQDHTGATGQAGDLNFAIYLQPKPGQLSYPSGQVKKCSMLRFPTTSTYQLLGETQDCAVTLTQLQLASAANVCDGRATGIVEASFSGQPVVGSFDLPVDVSSAQLAPSCRAPGAPCTQHSQCCSSSCFVVVGTCN